MANQEHQKYRAYANLEIEAFAFEKPKSEFLETLNLELDRIKSELIELCQKEYEKQNESD